MWRARARASLSCITTFNDVSANPGVIHNESFIAPHLCGVLGLEPAPPAWLALRGQGSQGLASATSTCAGTQVGRQGKVLLDAFSAAESICMFATQNCQTEGILTNRVQDQHTDRIEV